MNIIKRLIYSSLLVLPLVGFVGLASERAMAAAPSSTVCQTLGSDNSCTTAPANGIDIYKLVRSIVSILSLIVGVAAIIMIVIGGFKFITSGGDPTKVKSARSTLLYALIGIVVAVSAQLLVTVVFNQASTLDTTTATQASPNTHGPVKAN